MGGNQSSGKHQTKKTVQHPHSNGPISGAENSNGPIRKQDQRSKSKDNKRVENGQKPKTKKSTGNEKTEISSKNLKAGEKKPRKSEPSNGNKKPDKNGDLKHKKSSQTENAEEQQKKMERKNPKR